jgi:uncharacterized membrane protein YbhN (UPF0104 family)
VNFFIFTAEPVSFMTFLKVIQNNKRALLYCVRVIVTGGLFTFALLKVDIIALLSAFNRLTVAIPLFIAGFAGIILSQILFAWRTHRLLAANNMPSVVWNIFLVNFSSNFYNLIFPSSVAGGAVRWYRFGKPRGERWESLSIIVMERIIDNACWLILLVGAFASLYRNRFLPFYYCGAAIVLLIAGAVAMVILYRLPIQLPTGSTSACGFSLRLQKGMAKVNDTMYIYLGKRRELAFLSVYSLCTNLLLQFFVFLLLTSVAGPLRFDIFLAASIVIYITSQIPLTVSGIGLNEFVFSNICRLTGLSTSTGFLFGFIGSLINISLGLLAGIVELFSKGQYIRDSKCIKQ